MAEKNKKTFKMPHTFVIMMVIILFATLLTWIIPAGQYVRVENADGVKVVDPNQFSFIDRCPVNPLLIPLYIVNSMCKRVDLMLVIIFSGGAFDLISKSGALHSAVARVAKVFQNRLYIFIPIMTTIFALICTTQGVNQFIAFAPVVVMITLAMGLDSIVGAAIIQYRAVCFVVFLIITNIYLVRYALKIRKNPELSPMYDLDSQNEQKDLDIDSFGTMDVRKTLIIIALVAALAGMVVGSVKFGWDMPELAAVFVGLGIVVGFIAGETPSNMSKVFVEGCKKMLTAAMIIGLASAIASIMSAGKIVDTVVYALASCLRHTPSFFMAPAMYIANTLINFVIVSGSGQAAAIMPIMIPVSDLLGVTRQTSVLAYNFGDGFCNYILPHSTALMGIISAVNIPYDRWLKFIWKLFLIWAVTACIMTAIAQGIHLGPM